MGTNERTGSRAQRNGQFIASAIIVSAMQNQKIYPDQESNTDARSQVSPLNSLFGVQRPRAGGTAERGGERKRAHRST